MKKILDVNSIHKKSMDILKQACGKAGINLADQAGAEILRAIETQSASNLEIIIAENLAMDVVDKLNSMKN